MGYSQEDLITRFRQGKKKGSASNMFIDEEVLYSYGRHFPLLIRMPFGYLMNGDRYSSSTSAHQRKCSRLATIIIPFSILVRAGIAPMQLQLIDKSDQVWEDREYTDPKTGEKKTYQERRPDSCIVQFGDRQYLSSMDAGSYYMSLLPRKIEKVIEAYDILRPDMADGEEGTDYQRQGEWFFIPLSKTLHLQNAKVVHRERGRERVPWKHLMGPDGYRYEPKRFLKNRNPEQEPHHYANEYGEIEKCPYPVVRGQVRHQNGDHRMLQLGKEWHLAIESNHLISYGAGRRVD